MNKVLTGARATKGQSVFPPLGAQLTRSLTTAADTRPSLLDGG